MENIKAVPRGTHSLTSGSLQRLRTGLLITTIFLHPTLQKVSGPGTVVVAVSTERNEMKLPPWVCVYWAYIYIHCNGRLTVLA